MPVTGYIYTISSDFPNGICNETNLTFEINASSIVTALVCIFRNNDTLTICCADALAAGEKTLLDGDTSNPPGGLIAASDPTTPPDAAFTTQIQTTATLDADKNNFGGLDSASSGMFRISSSLDVNITGLSGGADGRLVRMHNIGSFVITFKDEDAGSLAINRFVLSMDLSISPGECVDLQYDDTSKRWRAVQIFPSMIGDSGSGGRKGMVTAPAAGDAAAGKFLKADATWAVGFGDYIATATIDTTTTSPTDILINSMSITPTAGTYAVWFTGSVKNSSNKATTFTSIYAAGSQYAPSERLNITLIFTSVSFVSVARVTVNGAQTIEGQWRVSTGTATMHQRVLYALRVA